MPTNAAPRIAVASSEVRGERQAGHRTATISQAKIEKPIRPSSPKISKK